MKQYDPVQIISKKRDGGTLSEDEVRFFVASGVNGTIPDYQTSALLMAVYFRGLSDEETNYFVKAIIDSGEKLDLSFIKRPKVDKHSTGGVGDKTSLILAPLVACFDVAVPMISGRGLGHTGGTLDKLESIPGFRVNLSVSEFISNLEKINVSMIGQTDRLTPADKKLYELRDVTGTVENIGLIVSSITSKKIAEGSDAIVYDVKTGKGSTLPDRESSRELALKLLRTTRNFNIKALAMLTDMDEPLGYAIGNWVEVEECINIIDPEKPKNGRSADLKELTLFLAGAMLMLAGKCNDISKGAEMAEARLESGDCYRKFIELVSLQGGDISVIKDTRKFPTAALISEVNAGASGYISELNAAVFGHAAVSLGCGRTKIDGEIDYSAGIILRKKKGDPVTKGDVICELRAGTVQKIESARLLLHRGIAISDNPVVKKSKIIEVID